MEEEVLGHPLDNRRVQLASNDPVKSAPSLQLNSGDREGDARVQFSAARLQFEFIRRQKNKFKKSTNMFLSGQKQ